MLMILINGFDRGAGSILVGVTDRIAGHRRLVRIRSLAAEVAFFDVLLGVVPRAAAGGHGNGDEQAGDDGADQQSAQRLERRSPDPSGIHDEHQHDGYQDGQKRGMIISLDRRLG